ncbi:DUF2157 domain-containing protein [Mucilaginibacter pallidiroseus]|uniref:DUF2157 domain-containing protein n=1 Tax=Mucilaginibacter pallidiroseus TaxID=2599295 RepID=A0A563U564_9SPHI|nr:DUF2157 domain-containing protein [Mucilaginibacter pallidiroseus]TWR26473.1 DUF2157 domain-containing protein [Mucilaginibacter pallidiroseus]
MSKLNLDRQESEFLNDTISRWEKEHLIDTDTAGRLRNSYEVRGFDWMRLAKYSIWVALFCGAIAIGSIIVDDAVIKWLQGLYYTPDILISILSGMAAAGLFLFGRRREKIHPEKVFSNEAVIFLGVFFTACCIAYLGKTFDNGSGHYSLLFLASVFVYGVLAWRMQSRLIWLFALVSLGSWFGTETGYQTNWALYFLGMNYPLRFVLFGLLLVGACYLLKNKKWFKYFWELTYVVGMLYLFISLWLLSIFGNYGSLDTWWTIRQISLYYWGIISAVVAGLFLLYGLKNKDVIAREFGITFLIIFLYTKYFEYFWDHTNKTLFFSILALSFWLIGRKAEKIWNVNAKSESPAGSEA